jgi:hypothetical protein
LPTSEKIIKEKQVKRVTDKNTNIKRFGKKHIPNSGYYGTYIKSRYTVQMFLYTMTKRNLLLKVD